MPGLLKSGTFVAGLLILGVGVADVLTGHLKVVQYEAAARVALPPEAPTAPSLFPPASEGREQLRIARVKLGFYQLLTTVGWGLTATGCVVLMLGLLRTRPITPATLVR